MLFKAIAKDYNIVKFKMHCGLLESSFVTFICWCCMRCTVCGRCLWFFLFFSCNVHEDLVRLSISSYFTYSVLSKSLTQGRINLLLRQVKSNTVWDALQTGEDGNKYVVMRIKQYELQWQVDCEHVIGSSGCYSWASIGWMRWKQCVTSLYREGLQRVH